jgi:predicted GH43/DUF377 family glycosyl hydrolase
MTKTAAAVHRIALVATAVLLALAGPSAAYEVEVAGFADGTDFRELTFSPTSAEISGPSLRLLTNSSVNAGSIVVAGHEDTWNFTASETTSGDFISNRREDGLLISGGSITLSPISSFSSYLVLNASNLFGGASFRNSAITGGSLRVANGTRGSFVSDNVSAPLGGWGTLMARGSIPLGASISISILAPEGPTIVANQGIGAIIDLDPIAWPSVRVQGVLDTTASPAPASLEWVGLGGVAGEPLIGGGVSRNNTNVVDRGGQYTIRTSTTSYTKDPRGPTVAVRAGTYYSSMVTHSYFLNVSGTWHYFFGAFDGAVQTIGHATSTDLQNWTIDASPVLLPTPATWDQGGVAKPNVVPDGNGTGWLMYYMGINGPDRQVGVATSTDLKNWTKFAGNPVLSKSSSGWDSAFGTQAVVINGAGNWQMWYSGSTNPSLTNFNMGYATSADGFNWTKYSANPVLVRGGAGAIDSEDLQVTSVRVVGGTYYAFLACHAGFGGHRGCLATSSDGITWTKFSDYIVTPGTGWDSVAAFPDDMVVQGGRFVVFYTGANGATAQVGRMDANYENGVARGTVDFQARKPLRLESVQVDAIVPAGSIVEVSIRSSEDGNSWSGIENVTSHPGYTVTPAARFVQWVAYLNGTPRSDAPTLQGISIHYSTFTVQGRYESDPIGGADPISGVQVDVTVGGFANGVAFEISNDNGTSWTRVQNHTFTSLALAGTHLIYAILFEGRTSETPVVDEVALVIQAWGVPQNVSLRLGGSPTPFYNQSGPLIVAHNVSLPTVELNDLIQLTLLQLPGSAFVDVPLVVSSTHFGRVEVREPRLTVTLKNPLVATYSPSGNAFSILENETITMVVNASTFPASVAINTTWQLDGSPLPTSANHDSYVYAADFASAGNHTVRVDVENGDFALNHTWTLRVQDVDRPPSFAELSPVPGAVEARTFENVSFGARATDPDGDAVVLQWFDGNVQVNGAGPIMFRWTTPGPHVVRLEMSSTSFHESVLWNVTVVSSNSAPQITAFVPPGATASTHVGQRLNFSVSVLDDGALPLEIIWRLDGTEVARGTVFEYAASSSAVGSHRLVAEVTDGEYTSSKEWNIQVTAAPTEATQPGFEAWAAILVGLALGAALFGGPRRRR